MSILRKIILILLIFGTMLGAVPIFSAETILYGYYVDIEDLGSNVSKYVSSIYLSKNESTYGVYINGEFQKECTGNLFSVSFAPNANTYYIFSFDTESKTASSYYKNTTSEPVVSIFSFSIKDALQYVVFKKDVDDPGETRSVKKNASGIYDFGTFSFVYNKNGKSQTVYFDLKVNANTNNAVIIRDGKEYTYSLEGTGKNEVVYCENLVEAQELDLNYMESSLEKQTLSSAKTIMYSNSAVDSALRNQTITLFNNKTGLSTTVPLQRTLTYWKRTNGSDAIGDGSYDETASTIQVVCQWNEDLCQSIRTKYTSGGRPFAVYGTSTTYDYVEKTTKKAQVEEYNNISWPASSWSSSVSRETAKSNLNKTYGIIQYQTASKTWGSYGSWEIKTSKKLESCKNSNDCEYETRTAYAYKTRDFGDWSGYTYESCTDSSDTECKGKLYYAERHRTWGPWSSYIYTGAETLSCSDVGSSLGSNCDRESEAMYAKQTGSYSSWSSFSSWDAASCISSDTKNCESRTMYAYRSLSAWSEWEPTTLNASCFSASSSSGGNRGISALTKDCKTETQYRYKTRSLSGYTYSGYAGYKTSKYGSYQSQCNSTSITDAVCGVKAYNSCRTSACGVESTTYKSCQNSACGVASTTYKSCQNSACGVASTVYKSCQNKACGVASTTYKSCQNTACGASSITYQTCKTSACGVDYYIYKSCATSSCGCKTYKANASLCGKNIVGAAKRCEAAGCETYNTCSTKACGIEETRYKSCQNSACGVQSITYKSCRTSACGVESTTYKSCQNSACGVDHYNYNSCRTSACGVESTTYKSCRTSACGVESTTYKSCENSACGVYSYKTCTTYNCPTSREENYSSWSSWSDWSTSSCSESSTKTCDTKTVNYKRTREWGDWSSYIYSSASTSSTTDHKQRTETRYQTRSFNWGDYSDYIYTSCTESDTVNCKKETRWRVRYLSDWSSLSAYNLDSCTLSDTTQCYTKVMYSKRTLGDWSSSLTGVNVGVYTLTSCSDSNTKLCQSQEQIRMKNALPGTYGSWSGSYTSLDAITEDSNLSYQYRYNNGIYTKSTEKGTSNEVGIGSMFVSLESTGYKDVEVATVASRSITNSSRMTSDEISAFASELGNAAGQAHYVSSYIASSEKNDTSGNKYVTWDYWQSNEAVYTAAANAAVSQFTNEKRFIPYIFITEHFRATNKTFYITGYDSESIVVNTEIENLTEEENKNAKLIPDEETIYDYCEIKKDTDECFCQEHPNDSRCKAPEPEPSYCEVHPDETVCFCASYPMSDRCKAKTRETAVIYMNYLDPLENYQGSIPSNWEGYLALVDEIKKSDLNKNKIQVTLSEADLLRMRAWIEQNEDKIGSCDMIRAFSYIFTQKNDELSSWLKSSDSCKVN